MTLFSLLLLFSVPAARQVPPLEEAVRAYWTHLQGGDKEAALAYVSPDSRLHFLSRNEPPFRSWKIESIQSDSEDRAEVTVLVERLLPTGFFDWKIRETWIYADGRWGVVIPDPVKTRRELFVAGEPKPLPPRLEVVPSVVRIHFLSRTQEAVLAIRNGLDKRFQVTRLEPDIAAVTIVDDVAVVEPFSSVLVRLRYVGENIQKNQQTRLHLVLEGPSGSKTFAIPLTYNYLSPGALGVFGLTEEQARQLRRKIHPRPRKP